MTVARQASGIYPQAGGTRPSIVSPALHGVHYLLERIGALFAIEEDMRGQSPQERQAVRAERSVPLLAQIKTRFEETLGRISRKSSLADALRYALARWDALTRYTTDGRLDICNNAAERANTLRIVAT